MKTAFKTAASKDQSGKLQLDDLGYLFQKRPFSLDRVTEPTTGELDVPEIHDTQFAKVVRKAEESLQCNQAIGLVLWGEAGIGKSHFLGRLADWAQKEGACCVLLQNINSSASRLVGSIQRSVISQLTRGRQDGFSATTLYDWILRAVKGHLRSGENSVKLAFRRIEDDLSERHPTHASLDRPVLKALRKFFEAAYQAEQKGTDERKARLAVAWLLGDRPERAECELLGLPSQPEADQGEDADDSQTIRLLVVLGELARAADRPFVLCFDQVDVLDDEKMCRLSTFLHLLLDAAKNLLAITCGVQQTLIEMRERRVFTEATWHRIAKNGNVITLPSIDREQARKLLEVRMQPFVEQLRQFPDVWTAVETDGLFPLGNAWFAERFAESPEYRPRKVVHFAQDRWEEQERRIEEIGVRRWLEVWASHGSTPAPRTLSPVEIDALVDEKIDGKIREQMMARQLNPGSLPPDADNYVGLMDALLRQCLDHSDTYLLRDVAIPVVRKTGPKPAHQRIVTRLLPGQSTEEQVGLTVVTTDNATSAAGYLRRLRDTKPPPQRSLLVTDRRQPLRLGGAGKAYLTELERGGDWPALDQAALPFAEIAQLDALQAVVAQGKAGDIEVDLPDGAALTVSEKEVVASHHRRDRYRSCPLLARLLGSGDVVASRNVAVPRPPHFEVKAVERFIMAQLALTIGMASPGLATKFAMEHGVPEEDRAALHSAIVGVATQLHEKNQVNATPREDGLFLLLK